MNIHWVQRIGLLAVLSWMPGALVAASSEPSCNKSCLAGVTEQYLDAMVRGSLEGLPLSSKVRATSNSQVVAPGKGATWQPDITVVNRHTFYDQHTQAAIFFGTIAGKPKANRTWWHYALRLSVDGDGNIAEIEEQSATVGFQSAEKVEVPFKESAIFSTVLPEDERVSAADLVLAADSYWSALNSGEGGNVPFGPDCQRTEFGKYSTNATMTHDRTGDPTFISEPRSGKSCRSFFENDRFRWTTKNRRYYIVDEARGVVVAVGQLQQFGDDGIPGLTLIEAFKIVNGNIEFLWAPALTWSLETSGWPDWQRPQG